MPWSTDDEALGLANDTTYGLSGYVWCRDISRALRLAQGIEAGGVQINRGGGPLPGMSDGGIKQSGVGREHSLEAAVEEFTYRKGVAVGLDR
jgi:phenylacetaldehyde dehydrogenase